MTDLPSRTESDSANIRWLMAMQAVTIASRTSVTAFAALAGHMLADNLALATFPVALTMVANALWAAPFSLFMERFGRVAGFHVGVALGTLGAIMAALGIYWADFILFTVAMVPLGGFFSSGQFYRYAASESVATERQPRAISMVLVGGLFGAIILPGFSKWTNTLFLPYQFMGIYIGVAVLTLLTHWPINKLRGLSGKRDDDVSGVPRPLSVIMRQRGFVVALLNAALGYAMMSFIMTGTPLAMQACGFDAVTGSTVIQGHVIAMFLPGLFTGTLIQRYGVTSILLVGQMAFAVAFLFALNGVAYAYFYAALVFLGVGWNFCFVGATTLLTRLYHPWEKGRVHALSETMIFGFAAAASLASGGILRYAGWSGMNKVSFGILAVTAVATMVYGMQEYLRGRKAVRT